jgi:hypothetical protein
VKGIAIGLDHDLQFGIGEINASDSSIAVMDRVLANRLWKSRATNELNQFDLKPALGSRGVPTFSQEMSKDRRPTGIGRNGCEPFLETVDVCSASVQRVFQSQLDNILTFDVTKIHERPAHTCDRDASKVRMVASFETAIPRLDPCWTPCPPAVGHYQFDLLARLHIELP